MGKLINFISIAIYEFTVNLKYKIYKVFTFLGENIMCKHHRHLYEWMLLLRICNEMGILFFNGTKFSISSFLYKKYFFLPLYPFVDWHSSSQRDKFNFFIVICVLEKHHLLLEKHAKWFWKIRRMKMDEQNCNSK